MIKARYFGLSHRPSSGAGMKIEIINTNLSTLIQISGAKLNENDI